MDIGFVWDENKYRKTLRKHNIKFYEVVSAFDDPHGFELRHPKYREAKYADRWVWVGQAFNGRILAVSYSDEDLPLYRLITAYDAKGVLLDEYHQRPRV